MKKNFNYLIFFLLFSIITSGINIEKECDLRKNGWYVPDCKKYKKSESKRFKIENIPEEFVIQYYVLKEQYKDELFQIEMKLTSKSELRKYRLKNYGVIKLVNDESMKIIAYEYSLFEIGDLVYEEGKPDVKFYTAGSAILPMIILDLDEDNIYESCWDKLEWTQNGFIDRRNEIIKIKYKKMMEKDKEKSK